MGGLRSEIDVELFGSVNTDSDVLKPTCQQPSASFASTSAALDYRPGHPHQLQHPLTKTEPLPAWDAGLALGVANSEEREVEAQATVRSDANEPRHWLDLLVWEVVHVGAMSPLHAIRHVCAEKP
eukprot:SAG31_NODE_8934_length_1361_cov_1.301109_2_plen_125_part_00